jgi:hypothetical protein
MDKIDEKRQMQWSQHRGGRYLIAEGSVRQPSFNVIARVSLARCWNLTLRPVNTQPSHFMLEDSQQPVTYTL